MLSFLLFACDLQEEIINDKPEWPLSFSADTISFDTLFTSRTSVTKRLYVRNPNRNAISIDKIHLGKGEGSEFDIIVAGIEKKEHLDQVILGNDSLLVLISVNIDPSQETLPFIIRDSLLFEYQDFHDEVKLMSWGQNAYFLDNTIISQDQTWTNEKPFFLVSSILIDSLVTLKIKEGARIFAGNNAYIFVKGTMICEGDSADRILFRNERLEEEYENVPGQWGGIFILEGSGNNLFEFTDIRNAEYGLRVGTPDQDTIPDVIVRNSRIENTTIGGLVAFTSDIYMENSLVNTSAGFNIANIAGGNYYYNHCTFANYTQLFFRNNPSIYFSDNIVLDDGSVIVEDLFLHLTNSIIWGNISEEIQIDLDGGASFSFKSWNCILKTSLNILETGNNIIETETEFMTFRDIENYNYTPDSLSAAIDFARNSGIHWDLFGNPRDSVPDAGAVELLK